MTPRRRTSRLILATVLCLAAGAAPAAAAPRVQSVDGIAFSHHGVSDYVAFVVRTKGATRVRMSWGRRGGAHPRVRRGLVGIGYARRNRNTYRIRIRACKRKRCGRVQRFSGRFREVDTVTEPPPNSAPQATPPPTLQFIGQLPAILPTLDNIPVLSGLPLPTDTQLRPALPAP